MVFLSVVLRPLSKRVVPPEVKRWEMPKSLCSSMM
jgi:hypothetical protein